MPHRFTRRFVNLCGTLLPNLDAVRIVIESRQKPVTFFCIEMKPTDLRGILDIQRCLNILKSVL